MLLLLELPLELALDLALELTLVSRERAACGQLLDCSWEIAEPLVLSPRPFQYFRSTVVWCGLPRLQG